VQLVVFDLVLLPLIVPPSHRGYTHIHQM